MKDCCIQKFEIKCLNFKMTKIVLFCCFVVLDKSFQISIVCYNHFVSKKELEMSIKFMNKKKRKKKTLVLKHSVRDFKLCIALNVWFTTLETFSLFGRALQWTDMYSI